MYYTFKAIKDTFIDESNSYSGSNFGRDELLEVGRPVSNNTGSRKRILIDFDISSISSSIASGLVPATASFELKLFECLQTGSLPDDIYLDAHIITTTWSEGTGSKAFANKNGYCSWFSASSTTEWTTAGGDYSSSISASQHFITGSGDLSIDVTTLISGSVISGWNNKGLLIKKRDEITSGSMNPKLFYSKDTHTIYEPKLIAKWIDSTATGSLAGQDSSTNYTFALRAPKAIYSVNEKPYFEVYVRQAYPTLSWSTTVQDISSIALNNLSFQIDDVITNETVIPFCSQSQLSYDATTPKNFFYVYLQNLEPYRSYNLLIRHSFSGSLIQHKIHQFFIIE